MIKQAVNCGSYSLTLSLNKLITESFQPAKIGCLCKNQDRFRIYILLVLETIVNSQLCLTKEVLETIVIVNSPLCLTKEVLEVIVNSHLCLTKDVLEAIVIVNSHLCLTKEVLKTIVIVNSPLCLTKEVLETIVIVNSPLCLTKEVLEACPAHISAMMHICCFYAVICDSQGSPYS